MRNIKEFFILFLFMIWLTCFVMFFKERIDSEIPDVYNNLSEVSHNDRYTVAWQENGVSLRLPIEYFIIGALAATVPVEYEPELLKSQAILLRSTIYKKYKESGIEVEGKNHISLREDEISFWGDEKMQNIWKTQYEENLQKCMEAVIETQGIYLSYEGHPICGFYHGMSSGKTRSGKELVGEEDYSYLKAMDCVDNLSAPDYETETEIRIDECGILTEEERNEAGYIISVKSNGRSISGEALREKLGLLSSNVTWTKKGDIYLFRTKGKGHGFGLDQYYGNVMAKKGMDYREILDSFFVNTTFQRME